MKYWLYEGDNVIGPFSLADIQQMIDRGLVKKGDLICRDGETEWRKAEDLRELDFARSTGSAPTPLPQAPKTLLPACARYNSASDTFTATMPQMLKLAMRAIQDLGWKLENANETLGMITFETGASLGSWSGVACSLTIEEAGKNKFRVIGTAKQNLRGGQILALNLFGEAQGKVRAVINRMKELAKGKDVAQPVAEAIQIDSRGGFYVMLPGDDQRRPMGYEDMKRLFNTGLALPTTPAWQEGDDEWKTVGRLLIDAC